MRFLRLGLLCVGALAGCGGGDNSAVDSGVDGSPVDATIGDAAMDSAAADGGSDANMNDTGTDAGTDAQCTALPDASFTCGGNTSLKCNESEYCIGGGIMNACEPNPSQCDCVETHDCACLTAHFVSPCDGGGGTFTCSNVNDAGDYWMLGSCL